MIKFNKPRIQEFLKFRRWKQTDFAKALNFSDSYLTLLLNGDREPSAEVMERIVNLTGLSFDDLFFCTTTYKNVSKANNVLQSCKTKKDLCHHS